jgi:hypothetical protein
VLNLPNSAIVLLKEQNCQPSDRQLNLALSKNDEDHIQERFQYSKWRNRRSASTEQVVPALDSKNKFACEVMDG